MHRDLTPCDIEKFWNKVDVGGANDCWMWRGTRSGDYGLFHIPGANIGAHRVSWEIAKGSVPDGMHVCHNCPGGDNPYCVNPAHLFVGTRSDNMRDMLAKGRGNYIAGSRNKAAKLTEADVPIVRELYESGFSQRKIAAIYKVAQTTIGDVTSGKGWRHVE